MRLEMSGGPAAGAGGIVRVILSERNLKTLLAKLEGHPRNSECTITYDTRDGVQLFVSAEPDAIHYANPERDLPVPGLMHPDTEERIR